MTVSCFLLFKFLNKLPHIIYSPKDGDERSVYVLALVILTVHAFFSPCLPTSPSFLLLPLLYTFSDDNIVYEVVNYG